MKVVMTLAVIALNVGRKPQLLAHPRFFAEEGTNFFAFAYNNDLLHYILTPMFGYYALYNVIATSLASVVRLEVAPLVTTYLAFAVQVATSLLIIWGKISLLDSTAKRFAAAVSLPLLCPSQIWLTTIGVQYWLCVVTILILLQDPVESGTFGRAGNAVILTLNGLTGILSCLLTPLFIIRYFIGKSRHFLLYAGVLASCSLIQLLIFLHWYQNNTTGFDGRFSGESSLAGLFYNSTILFLSHFLLFGKIMDAGLYYLFDHLLNFAIFKVSGGVTLQPDQAMYLLASMVMAVVTAKIIRANIRNQDSVFLALSAALIYYASVALSINSIGGHRYMFAPGAAIMFLLVSSWSTSSLSRPMRAFLTVILAAIFFCHGSNYRASMNRVYNKDWPDWENEVRLWKQDKSYQLKIWPPPWEVNLQDSSSLNTSATGIGEELRKDGDGISRNSR